MEQLTGRQMAHQKQMSEMTTDNNEQYLTATCKEILYPFYIYYLWSVLFVYLITVSCISLNLHHSLASLSGLHLVIPGLVQLRLD